jgi:TPP-dependent pyruvate/acetoin dehydrogenase alpha subunit
MSKMLDQLKDGSEKQNVELQKEKDEVTRLKAEMEALKKAHSDEIMAITSSCSAEIEEAKKSFDTIRVEGIAAVIKRLTAE